MRSLTNRLCQAFFYARVSGLGSVELEQGRSATPKGANARRAAVDPERRAYRCCSAFQRIAIVIRLRPLGWS